MTPNIASAAALRPPPNAQHNNPVRKTFAAPAKAEINRNDHIVSCPKSISLTRACSATSGG